MASSQMSIEEWLAAFPGIAALPFDDAPAKLYSTHQL